MQARKFFKILQYSLLSFSFIFSLPSVCRRADYYSLDRLWLVPGLTRAVGQGHWPRCGSYPALKSISEGNKEKCTSLNTLQLCRNSEATETAEPSFDLAYHECTVQTGTQKQYLDEWDVSADSPVLFDSGWQNKISRKDMKIRQIETAWCKHS